MLHNPSYDFNDDLIPLGATYWVRLAEAWLAQGPRMIGAGAGVLAAATPQARQQVPARRRDAAGLPVESQGRIR